MYCTTCGGQKRITIRGNGIRREHARECGICKGTGEMNREFVVKFLRQAIHTIESRAPGMPRLTDAVVAISDAIREIEGVSMVSDKECKS